MQKPTQLSPVTTTTTAAGAAATNRAATVYCIGAASLFSLLFVLSLSSTSKPYSPPTPDPFLFPDIRTQSLDHPSPPTPPSIAYLVSGSDGDSNRILRLLFAIYHPKNHYLIHLDLATPQSERDSLAGTVNSIPIFAAANNVDVIGKSDFAYRKGSSSLSSTLHGASLLLRISSNWDWFINLSAAEYPLVTQDDLLHILSYLPRDLNFVNHTSYIGWRESRRLKPIVVDPGLYLSQKDEIFYAIQKRKLPDAYQVFLGSSSSILSREFIDYCISGTENLPRTLLMYLANTPSPLSVYFPTILCNSHQFKKTTINQGLQFTSLNTKQEPQFLNSSDYKILMRSGVAFASPFLFNDPVLDIIDEKILGRRRGKPAPGGWCLGESGDATCSVWGDADVLRPGPAAKRLAKRIVKLLSNGNFRSRQCVVE